MITTRGPHERTFQPQAKQCQQDNEKCNQHSEKDSILVGAESHPMGNIIVIIIISVIRNEISFSEGTLQQHIERKRKELPDGAWPIIAEERCFVVVSSLFKAVDFLNSNGLVHGDIKGNSLKIICGWR